MKGRLSWCCTSSKATPADASGEEEEAKGSEAGQFNADGSFRSRPWHRRFR